MPRTYSSTEKIRAELAWITETPDPHKCGCRNVRCCEENCRDEVLDVPMGVLLCAVVVRNLTLIVCIEGRRIFVKTI